MKLADYYATELSYLRETAQAFASEHPAIAAALLDRGTDPDVERLLEGVAFLTAGMRSRVDRAGMEIAHHLAELTLPHLLRSLPAATIVELEPDVRALRARHRVPSGRLLRARPVEGTKCGFTTCFDVDLWPVSVADLHLSTSRSDRPVIRLVLEVSEAGRGALDEEAPLRFFIHHTDAALPAMLQLWLSRHLVEVRVLAEASGGSPATLKANPVRALAPSEHAVFPWPKTAPVGYRSVLEVFALPEKLCFFELHGLHEVDTSGATVVVEFEFDRPPKLPAAIGRETLRLHCTPAVNLFEAPAEPISYDVLTREAIVRAEGVDARHMEIYEVTSVGASDRSVGGRRTYVPFAQVAAYGARRPPSFSLRRALSPIDSGIDTYISLLEPPDLESRDGEVLSLRVRCTNRFLTRELRTRYLGESRPGGLIASYTNITPVSSPVRMALGEEALWRLLSHLALNQRGPVDARSLRSLLRLYNFHAGADVQAGQANERQIEAIREVSREAVTRLIRGVPIRAARTTIELDERGFPGIGRAFLFGAVLNELFASLININAASEVKLVLSPSKQEYVWPVRVGS